MNTTVDNYLLEGCGRCSLGGTPECKVHKWTSELHYLRSIVNSCGLTEETKWGVPCYTFNNKNILLISAFKEYCSINFFKGALLADPNNILVKPGENSQAARQLKFKNFEAINNIEAEIKAYIFEAIEVEKAGLKINFDKKPLSIPDELEQKFEEDPIFKIAFEALTPGRQRGYSLHFSQPKQAKTRLSRIEKCSTMIINGMGLNDNYKSRNK